MTRNRPIARLASLPTAILVAILSTGAPAQDLSDAERAAITAEQNHVIDSLERAGVFDRFRASLGKSLETRFAWPLAFDTGNGIYNCYSLTQFFDHDTSAGLLDYTGGRRTYNGHKGTDLISFPFAWYQMDSGLVRVVAAAPGVITGKREGNSDRSCAQASGVQWNAVYIRHADSSVAWYGHFRTGTVTTKAIGQSVTTGEVLGLVGSSGSSTKPHLHFEVHDKHGTALDPFAGPANPTVALSWWQSQLPYVDRGINRIMTHSRPPVFPTCPQQEILNQKTAFQPGDSIVCAIYMRIATSDRTIQLRVRRPDSTVWRSWSYTPGSTLALSSYQYWNQTLPADAPRGAWRFEADYDSLHYNCRFTVGTTGIAAQTNSRNARTVAHTVTYDLRGRLVPRTACAAPAVVVSTQTHNGAPRSPGSAVVRLTVR